MDVNEQQIGGAHYKNTKYQHRDFVILALEGRYLEGNITKYVTRWRRKNGLEDLRKAVHYLDKLIKEYTYGRVSPLFVGWRNAQHSPRVFCDANQLTLEERMVVTTIAHWGGVDDLERARTILGGMVVTAEAAVAAEGEPGRGYVMQGGPGEPGATPT